MTVIVIFAMKMLNSKCFVQREVNMGHLSYWVIFNLIATGLSCPFNDIRYISLRWLNIGIISEKCFHFHSQFEQQWFELELPYYLINLLWDDSYGDICDDMSEFEVFSSTRSKYGSSIALSNFQLDRSWFKFHLQWYWTDFFEITNIERISKKCSNFKCIWTTRSQYGSSIAWSNFQLDRNWFKLSQKRHQIYFFEMANIGIISKKCSNSVSIWTTVVWVRASVISNKSSMRWLLWWYLRWHVRIRSV